MKKESIILIGGGGHCRSCIDVLEQEDRFSIAGIIDMPERKGEKVFDYPVIGSDSDLAEIIKGNTNFLITLGHIRSPRRRIELFFNLKEMGASFPVIKSPLAYVSPHAFIDEGTIVMHNALINAGAKIGKNCIINTRALVEHDAVIEDYCHISTGAIINGGARMGRGSFFGSGAVSQEYITKHPDSFTKAHTLAKNNDE